MYTKLVMLHSVLLNAKSNIEQKKKTILKGWFVQKRRCSTTFSVLLKCLTPLHVLRAVKGLQDTWPDCDCHLGRVLSLTQALGKGWRPAPGAEGALANDSPCPVIQPQWVRSVFPFSQLYFTPCSLWRRDMEHTAQPSTVESHAMRASYSATGKALALKQGVFKDIMNMMWFGFHIGPHLFIQSRSLLHDHVHFSF